LLDCQAPREDERFAKAMRDAHEMVARKTVKPILIRTADLPGHTASVIAKAFALLRHGNLRPDQKGRLMLALSDLTDRVAGFAKAAPHPTISKIDRAQAALDRALGAGHADNAEDIIAHAMELLQSDKLEPADHSRISVLLNEARMRLKEAENGAKE
jgi:hypothetical protein